MIIFYWAHMLFPTQEKPHTLIEMDSASDNYANVENLMAASKLVKFIWEESLREP